MRHCKWDEQMKISERIEKLEEEVFSKKAEDKSIPVPDNIEFEKISECKVGLKFDENRVLYYFDGWRVTDYDNIHKVKTKLVPCKREDLKTGDWAYHWDKKNPDFRNKLYYGLIIDYKSHRFIENNKDIIVSESEWKYWWKVVIDE